MRSLAREAFTRVMIFTLLLLGDALTFTRGRIGNVIASGAKRPLVKIGMIRGNAAGNIVASFGKRFALGMTRKGALMFSCINCAARRVAMGKSSLGVVVRRSSGALSRIIMMNCNDVDHGSMADSVAAIGTSGLGMKICSSPKRLLRNGIPNLAMMRDDSPASNATSVSLHKTSSLHANTTVRPCCIVSNVPNVSLDLVTPRSVRDVSMLHSTSTATVCNSGTTGNMVLVAAGGNDGDRRASMGCDTCLTFSGVTGHLSVVATSRLHACTGRGGVALPGSGKTGAG